MNSMHLSGFTVVGMLFSKEEISNGRVLSRKRLESFLAKSSV